MSAPIHVSPWLSHNSPHVPSALLTNSRPVIPLWVSSAPLLWITSPPLFFSFLKDAAVVFCSSVSWEQVSSLSDCELWEQKLSAKELKEELGWWDLQHNTSKWTLQIRISYVSSYMPQVIEAFGLGWELTRIVREGFLEKGSLYGPLKNG